MRRLALLALALLTCSCRAIAVRTASMDGAAGVSGLGLAFAESDAGVFTLRLTVKNPTDVPATVQRVRFSLDVEGRPLAAGVRELAIPLGAREEADVAVRFPLVLPAGLEADADEQVQVRARVEGSVLLVFGGLERGAPFRYATRLVARGLPRPSTGP